MNGYLVNPQTNANGPISQNSNVGMNGGGARINTMFDFDDPYNEEDFDYIDTENDEDELEENHPGAQ